jgi:hypothetical protein
METKKSHHNLKNVTFFQKLRLLASKLQDLIRAIDSLFSQQIVKPNLTFYTLASPEK